MVLSHSADTASADTEPADSGGRTEGRRVRLGGGLAVIAVMATAAAFDTGQEDVFAAAKLRVLAVLTVGVALVVAFDLVRGRERLRWALPDLLVAGYLGWSVLAWIAAPDRGHQWTGERFQFQGLASVFIYTVLYGAGRLYLGTKQAVVAGSWWLLAAFSYVGLYGVLQQADADPVWDSLLDGRVFSTIGNPNTLASVLVMALPLAAYFLARPGGDVGERVIAGAATTVLALALVFTESRGGYLAAAIAGLVLLVSAPRPRWWSWDLLAAAALVAVVLAVAIGPVRQEVGEVWDRAGSSFDVEDYSRRFHIDGWRVTIEMVRDHPLLGIGHERFPEEFPAYRDAHLDAAAIERFSPYRLESPHSVPLAIAVASGLPALVLYSALVAAAALRLWRWKEDRWLRSCLLALGGSHLIADLFVTADLTSAATFWLFLGIAVSLTDATVASDDRSRST